MHRLALAADEMSEYIDDEQEMHIDLFVHRCHKQRFFRIENILRDHGYRIVHSRDSHDGHKIMKGLATDYKFSSTVIVYEMHPYKLR